MLPVMFCLLTCFCSFLLLVLAAFLGYGPTGQLCTGFQNTCGTCNAHLRELKNNGAV